MRNQTKITNNDKKEVMYTMLSKLLVKSANLLTIGIVFLFWLLEGAKEGQQAINDQCQL